MSSTVGDGRGVFFTISILNYASVSRKCKHLVMIGDHWFTKYAVENNVDILSAGLHPTCVSRIFCNLLISLGKVYTTILISKDVCVCVCEVIALGAASFPLCTEEKLCTKNRTF